MSDEIYRKLAEVLDTLSNGFPATDNQLQIRLLEKIFEPHQAGIYEPQLPHMDREPSEMTDEYHRAFGQQFFSNTPQI